jgi:hypothetical protein
VKGRRSPSVVADILIVSRGAKLAGEFCDDCAFAIGL